MARVTTSALLITSTILIAMAPATARAQEQRMRLTFTPAAATMSGDAEVALAGSFGYRFAERLWFEGDVTWIDAASAAGEIGLDSPGMLFTLYANPAVPPVNTTVDRLPANIGSPMLRFIPPSPVGLQSFPDLIGPLRLSSSGSALVATLGIRYDLPVQTERFRPYVAGGLGLNHTDHQLRFERTMLPPAFDQSFSHTGPAFSAGAGASIRAVRQLWVDVDARYFRLSRDRNVMRLGGGVSLRF